MMYVVYYPWLDISQKLKKNWIFHKMFNKNWTFPKNFNKKLDISQNV